jgi:hypothetical protein
MDDKVIIENFAKDHKWKEILSIFKSPPILEPLFIKCFYILANYYENYDHFQFIVTNILSNPNEYDEVTYVLLNYKFHEVCHEIIQIGLSIYKNNIFLLFKKSISSYYIGKSDDGLQSCDLLLLNKHTPDYIYKNSLNNLDFYIFSPFIQRKRITDIPILYPFRPMNLTILNKNNYYLALFRTVNYVIESTGKFLYEGKLSSLTTIIKFSPSLNYTFLKPINTDNLNITKYNSDIIGLEDCRFIDNNLIIATSAEYNKHSIPQIVLIRLLDNFDIQSIHPLFYENEYKCEKNWIPLPNQLHTDKILKFIYSFDPFIVISIDTENNYKSSLFETIQYDLCFREIRGSTNFIDFNDGYLLLLHYSKNIIPRIYYHRLCWFSKDFTKGKISSSFYFESKQIEYCTGMCFTLDNENLLFTYTVNDDKTSFAILPIYLLNNLLYLDFSKT